jgi:hypothetical protein
MKRNAADEAMLWNKTVKTFKRKNSKASLMNVFDTGIHFRPSEKSFTLIRHSLNAFMKAAVSIANMIVSGRKTAKIKTGIPAAPISESIAPVTNPSKNPFRIRPIIESNKPGIHIPDMNIRMKNKTFSKSDLIKNMSLNLISAESPEKKPCEPLYTVKYVDNPAATLNMIINAKVNSV